MTEGVWRDYYTGAELDDFPKPWKKPHDELRGEGSDCLGLYTWWPEKGHVIQFDTSWWEGDCTGAWRGCPCKILIFWFWKIFWSGCPCKNEQLPPLIFLRGLCSSSNIRTRNPLVGLQFTPIQRPHLLRDVWFKGGLSSKIRLDEVVEEKTIKWTISDDVWNVTAVTNAPKDSYALGKWEWTVTGDHVSCHKGKSDVLEETIFSSVVA